MAEERTSTGVEQRRELRLPLDATVAVDVETIRIEGSGENISSQGVFFTATGSIPVTVHIGSDRAGLRGELVRCESMGGGRFGIAIRFLEPLPPSAG
jgi:hypothetical protein